MISPGKTRSAARRASRVSSRCHIKAQKFLGFSALSLDGESASAMVKFSSSTTCCTRFGIPSLLLATRSVSVVKFNSHVSTPSSWATARSMDLAQPAQSIPLILNLNKFDIVFKSCKVAGLQSSCAVHGHKFIEYNHNAEILFLIGLKS